MLAYSIYFSLVSLGIGIVIGSVLFPWLAGHAPHGRKRSLNTSSHGLSAVKSAGTSAAITTELNTIGRSEPVGPSHLARAFRHHLLSARGAARAALPAMRPEQRALMLMDCAGLASEVLSEVDDDELAVIGQQLLTNDDRFMEMLNPKSVSLDDLANPSKTISPRPVTSYLEAAE